MIVIKPNDVKSGEIPADEVSRCKIDANKAVQALVRLNPEHVQYVKAERDTGDLLRTGINPFVEAAHLAYSHHLPLQISPDAIWYLITSGVASHINKNSESLRHKFVSHEGKKEIRVRRDDFVLNALNNPWHEAIDEFSVKIGENTNNNVADLLVANFSTTTKVARVVSQVVLMDAMQKYFDYTFSTMCGIPEIRISGDKQDWENVRNKVNKLIELIPDLQKWLDSGLGEILNNFVNAFDDKIDKDFWDQIYKGILCLFCNNSARSAYMLIVL
jgi:hypothetical protein